LKKGDLGGFEKLQGERIYGKRYNTKLPSKGYFRSRRLQPALAQAGKPVPAIDCTLV
jgi:hypothetical protein